MIIISKQLAYKQAFGVPHVAFNPIFPAL